MKRFAISVSLLGLTLIFSPLAVVASDVDELRRKAKEIRNEAMKLAELGHEQESDRLLHESKMLMEKAEKMTEANLDLQKSSSNQAQDEHIRHLKEHINELQKQQKSLKQEGASEPQLQEIRAMIGAKENELRMIRSRKMDKPDVPKAFHPQAEKWEAIGRRVHHLRVAAENLKLAEAHDLAHQLMEKAEIMERELHESKQRLAFEINNNHHKQEGLDIVRDLRAELEQLRAEVRELRQQIEKR